MPEATRYVVIKVKMTTNGDTTPEELMQESDYHIQACDPEMGTVTDTEMIDVQEDFHSGPNENCVTLTSGDTT